MIKKKSKKLLTQLVIFLTIIIGIVLLRIYVIDMFKIPSFSMAPALEGGDYIVVNKMSYGPRVMDWWKLLFDKKVQYHWHKGWREIKKGDVFVFNFPQYGSLNDKYPDMYGGAIVKRCYGMPGDTVIIKAEKKKINDIVYYEGFDTKHLLFPNDSTLNWTIDNYGPLWVPAKGSTMTLNFENTKHYKDMLLYEGYKAETRNDSVFLNGKDATDYTFKYNYYFMKGDNFYGSQDSRYWGFVPQTHVIGKAVLVLFSLDPDEPWYRCFRWGRFLKRVR
jgi:signal peptidase I